MTSSADAPRRWFVALATATALGCGGDGPVPPPPPVICEGASQPAVELALYEARTLTGDLLQCTVLEGLGAEYLVIPQLTDASLPYGGFGFRIGDPEAAPTAALIDAASLVEAGTIGAAPASDAQARLHAQLRTSDHALRSAPRSAPLALDTLRRFSVLNTLDAAPSWAAVDAKLRYDGTRVALYLDTLAASSLTDVELQQMGVLYDSALAPRILEAFGDGSDIDGNGKVIFLLTPTVNAMVSAASCAATGFVRGFFYGHDLASSMPTSNQGEVFYAYVPDPAGQWSCAHSKAEVRSNLPPTFIHELQHMISFGAHVLARGGASEEPWLNEGLSHVAEELGSLHWESVFPAPSGRTNPTQIFPDSAAAYINPNLLYSYRFLFSSGSYSLTGCAPGSFCSQSERGGIWLFLRWVIDQKGAAVMRQLVQTAQTGRTNLAAVTGESTAELLASFAIAVSADSLDGVPRASIPPRFRLTTRNLRQIYRKLFDAYGIAGGVSRPFPIAPLGITPGTSRTGTMRPGSFVTYALATDAGIAGVRLRFSIPDGSAFPSSSGVQLVVFRVR